LFVVWGLGPVGLVWVGLGHGSISSPGSGLGLVGSVIWWVGLAVDNTLDLLVALYFNNKKIILIARGDSIHSRRPWRLSSTLST